MAKRIERLHAGLDIQSFDCGQDALNQWFRKYALQAQAAHSSKTYVALDGDCVIGFFSLAVGHVEFDESSPRLKKGLARQPVPVMLLARLAVHKDLQGQGIGKALLREAVLRTLQAADIAGIRALVTHAKDEDAKRFYQAFDFMQSDTDPLHLYVLLKDLKALAGQ